MGAEILEGYTWFITDNGTTEDLGFHGCDQPPCPPRGSEKKPGQEDLCCADYLCDWENGYLVLTDDAQAPDLSDGWTAVAFEPDDDFTYDDGIWIVKLLYKSRSGHRVFAGYWR